MNLNQLTLYITKSPEEYTGGKQIEMPENGGSVGRNPNNTLSLIDHNRFISGSHCLISVYADTYYLSDISTNGMLINGNKLLKNQPISLHDGDTIMLGRYELSVGLEKLSNAINIAADISTESNSTDPLLNLAEYKEVEESEKGTVEDFFKETKRENIDTEDPVTHLNFTLKKDDNFLLNDQDPEENMPEAAPSRQLLDDTDSVYSEFHTPNMIPENWLSDNLAVTPKAIKEKITTEHIPDIKFNVPEMTKPVTEPENSQQPWEEITQTIQTTQTQQVSTPQAPITTDVEQTYYPEVEPTTQPVTPKTQPTPSDEGFKNAFFKGLGISATQADNMDTHFFQQMGTCLRLCINNLQKDLSEIKTTKDTEQEMPLTNIVELMLSLNQQQLLSPNELIEQILDELDAYKIKMSQATSDIVNHKIQTFDPNTFANNISDQSLFMPKRKLWKEYTNFYHKNSAEKVDISNTALQQKIKEQSSQYTKA